MIHVEDLNDEKIKGSLYPEEYQAVYWTPAQRTVAQVLKKRKRAGQLQHLVTFYEYPPMYSEWINV